MKDLLRKNKNTFIVGLVALFLLGLILYTKPPKQTSFLPTATMNRHTQQTVQFFTKVIGSQKRTKIYLPFSFQSTTFPLVIGYKQKDQRIKELLIYHPQTNTINWPSIREENLTLFQKEVRFKSIQEFLNSPSGNIVAEESLKEKYPNLNANLLHFSNDNPIDLEKTDFILTTQAPLKVGNATYYYENIIDTSDALLDDTGQITWVIRAADSDDQHVFFLGNIDITYLQ